MELYDVDSGFRPVKDGFSFVNYGEVGCSDPLCFREFPNTLLLPSATFGRSEKRPNRCQAIRDYVLDGGALVMIGGYMSFTGISALKKIDCKSIGFA